MEAQQRTLDGPLVQLLVRGPVIASEAHYRRQIVLGGPVLATAKAQFYLGELPAAGATLDAVILVIVTWRLRQKNHRAGHAIYAATICVILALFCIHEMTSSVSLIVSALSWNV